MGTDIISYLRSKYIIRRQPYIMPSGARYIISKGHLYGCSFSFLWIFETGYDKINAKLIADYAYEGDELVNWLLSHKRPKR